MNSEAMNLADTTSTLARCAMNCGAWLTLPIIAAISQNTARGYEKLLTPMTKERERHTVEDDSNLELDTIHRLLEAAEKCQSDESALMRIIDELERHIVEEDGPAWRYASAYAWYLHPRRLEEVSIQSRVDELLHQVLRENPSDYLSLLYLGHNRYDCGDYAAARQHFERAQKVAPKDYIGLKAHEMVVCSKVMEAGVGAALNELEAFIQEALNSSYQKEDIWPRELALALERRGMGDLSPAKLAKAVELADKLDRAGHLNGWFGGIVRGM